MKKSVKSLILCLASVLGVGAFATACGETDSEPAQSSSSSQSGSVHVHTYSDEWVTDSEGHFHNYTCDCGETPEKEAHVDEDNDGVCDDCGYQVSDVGEAVEETALAMGNNQIEAANVTYAYTAATDGTLTLAVGGAIMGMVEMSYTVNGGTSTALELSNTVSLELSEGDKVVITVVAEGYSSITASWAGVATAETALAIGSNQVNAADVTYAYTATEAGTLTLEVGNAIMGMVEMSYTVNGGTSTSLELSTTVDLELSEGDKVVITVIAEGYSSIRASWAVTPQGSGTSDDPYVLTATGDYTCEFPGGYDCVWYAYTPSVAGTVTVSTTFGENGWLQVGNNLMYGLYSNSGSGESVSATIDAGELCYIGVGDWAEGENTVPFTVSFEETATTAETALAMGNNQIEAADVTYAYTAATDGTLTLAVGGAIMGMVEMSYTVNGGTSTALELSNTVSLELSEGDKVVITVVAEGYSSITASWAGVAAAETALAIGSNQVNQADVTYAYTATEAGTLTLEVGNAIMGMVEMSYTVNGGTSTALELGNTVDLELSEGDKVVITVIAEGYSSIKASWAGEAGGSEGSTDSDGTEEGGSTQGSGTASDRWVITELPYTVTFEDTHDVYYVYTATEDCTLYFECPTGCLISEIGATKDDLGNYSLSVTAGQVVQFNPWSNGGTAPYTYTISKVAESDGSDGTQGSGTASDRWVITELPYTVTFEDTHDVYYVYTATEDCTLYFECPTGCLISEIGATKDDLGNYSLSVTAGQVVQFNPWSNGGTAPYTYTISKVAESNGSDDEGSDDEGGAGDDTNSSDVVTYMSAQHASGRYLKVEIDATNGTMTLTRSNMSGGWDASTSTAEYQYSFDGTTVTATNVSGQSCTFTWNADGSPATILWSSATFEGFTAQ